MPRSDRSSGSIAFTLRSGRFRSREIANTRRKVGQEEPQVLPCHIDRSFARYLMRSWSEMTTGQIASGWDAIHRRLAAESAKRKKLFSSRGVQAHACPVLPPAGAY
jgi:hypothetical protein